MADLHSPFQDHPVALEHFPSGSLVTPPLHRGTMNSSLKRHSNILDFALSSLLRRKAKNLSLLVVYTLIVFVIASLIFFVQALKREAALLLKDAPDMVVQRMIAGRHDLIPVGYGEKIGAIRGVSGVRPRLWGYYYDQVFGANYTLMVAGRSTAAGGKHHDRQRRCPQSAGPGRGDMLTLRASSGATPFCSRFRGSFPMQLRTGVLRPDRPVGQGFPDHVQLSPRLATDLAVTVANPRETHDHCRQDRRAVSRHPADPEKRDPADL